MVSGDLTFEACGELGPEGLPRLDVAIDDIEGAVRSFGGEDRPEREFWTKVSLVHREVQIKEGKVKAYQHAACWK